MKKLKLTQLAKKELAKKELQNIKGGLVLYCGSVPNGCGCGCIYEGSGGSSNSANYYANFAEGISTHNY